DCRCPAARSEIDHRIEWQHGGATDADNLQSLCRKHHALKSIGSWRSQREDGDVAWTSPLGGRAVAGPLERGLVPEVANKQAEPQAGEQPPPPF
ncbi:HNH endonuclease signature motif containing protein, partial [Sinomonas sp.]|uniref:HNH endonuclease signature motif containing protein n=1 Tax=Sinomonas sp. TaxID=1914986 RepID=UPI003F7F27E0